MAMIVWPECGHSVPEEDTEQDYCPACQSGFSVFLDRILKSTSTP